jgi:hypothetical protein
MFRHSTGRCPSHRVRVASEERYIFDRRVVVFGGQDRGRRMRCAISREAIDERRQPGQAKGIEGEPSGYRATGTAKSIGLSSSGKKTIRWPSSLKLMLSRYCNRFGKVNLFQNIVAYVSNHVRAILFPKCLSSWSFFDSGSRFSMERSQVVSHVGFAADRVLFDCPKTVPPSSRLLLN